MNIALLGATGRVGQAFIKEAQKHGHMEIFALVRSAGTVLPIPEKQIITGNARRREDVSRLISKADTVVSCLGTDGDDTLSAAMTHIIDGMKRHHVQRLITIGTAGILQSRLCLINTVLNRQNQNENQQEPQRNTPAYTRCCWQRILTGRSSAPPTFLTETLPEFTGSNRIAFLKTAPKSQSETRRIFCTAS